jgi:nicotinic acid mononucleotide adenylyltransferase
VLLLDVTQLGVSASGIRACVAAGLSPSYLTPESVIKYIHRHGLYQGRDVARSAQAP